MPKPEPAILCSKGRGPQGPACQLLPYLGESRASKGFLPGPRSGWFLVPESLMWGTGTEAVPAREQIPTPSNSVSWFQSVQLSPSPCSQHRPCALHGLRWTLNDEPSQRAGAGAQGSSGLDHGRCSKSACSPSLLCLPHCLVLLSVS